MAKDFVMNDQRKKAAKLVAQEGKYDKYGEFHEMSKNKICEHLGISVTTLWHWRKEPEFQQEVDRIKSTTGLARKSERINIVKKVAKKALDAILVKLDDEAELTMIDLETLLKEARQYLDILRKETDGEGGNTFIQQNNTFNLEDLGNKFKKRVKDVSEEGETKEENPYSDLLNNADEFIDESDKIFMDEDKKDD